jgi:riboflavin kinase/FMN adenylyltransferase
MQETGRAQNSTHGASGNIRPATAFCLPENGEFISQTWAAKAMSTHSCPLMVEAKVVHGEKLGRALGFPTANMMLPADVQLEPGVYAVWFRCEDGALHQGVSCFGFRPTVVENGAAILETTLFDFHGDLYGQTCSVLFADFIRPERRFDDLSSLVAQMTRDAKDAKRLLSGGA